VETSVKKFFQILSLSQPNVFHKIMLLLPNRFERYWRVFMPLREKLKGSVV